MIVTIQPPIRKEDFQWMLLNHWRIDRPIDPNRPLHITINRQQPLMIAAQDNVTVASNRWITADSLPENWRSEHAKILITLCSIWFSTPIQTENGSPDPLLVALADEDSMNHSTAIVDRMACGLDLRMMPPEAEALEVILRFPDNNRHTRDAQLRHTIKPKENTIHLLITDRQHRIAGHATLNIAKRKDGTMAIHPTMLLEWIEPIANIQPILAYAASRAVGR